MTKDLIDKEDIISLYGKVNDRTFPVESLYIIFLSELREKSHCNKKAICNTLMFDVLN